MFNQWLGLAVSIIICYAVAALASSVTRPSIGGWYSVLAKPAWTPPNWVFGPVWSTLYLMMAIAAWLVWRGRGFAGPAAVPLALFGAQLLLNGLWSFLFFGLRRPGPAFFEIVLLWCAVLATIISFWRVSPPAGALLLPYLVWVGFAALLNFTIWRMN